MYINLAERIDESNEFLSLDPRLPHIRFEEISLYFRKVASIILRASMLSHSCHGYERLLCLSGRAKRDLAVLWDTIQDGFEFVAVCINPEAGCRDGEPQSWDLRNYDDDAKLLQ